MKLNDYQKDTLRGLIQKTPHFTNEEKQELCNGLKLNLITDWGE